MRTRFWSIQTIALSLLPALCSAQSARPDTVVVAQVGDDSPVRLHGPLEVKSFAWSELQPSTAQADWQRLYDSAKAKKRMGKIFVFSGAGAIAAGIALMYHEEAAFTDCFNDLSSRPACKRRRSSSMAVG